MRSIAELLAELPQRGRLDWIGISPARRAAIEPLARVQIEVGTGLAGDWHSASGRGKRQVTLFQSEHLAVLASLLGTAAIDSVQLRRNLHVSGINLLALKDRRFRIGPVLLEGTGPCAPCSRMEETLGPGGYNALRGHGGITARVIEAGEVALGDVVAIE